MMIPAAFGRPAVRCAGLDTRNAGMTKQSIRSIAVCASLLAALLNIVAAAAQDTTGSGDDLQRRAAIRFLTGGDFPPFHYYDDEGVLTGFDVDLARAICLEVSAACDIRVRPWEDLLPALRRREADAIIASQAITPQALMQADFTDRYYYTPAWFAGQRGTTKLETTPEKLEGKKIAVAKGSAHEAYLRAFFPGASIQTFETPAQAREALMMHAADLVFDDGIGLIFWINGTLSKECCELAGGPFYDPKYFGDGIGIAVAKSDGALKALINQALRRVRETGRYEELMLRYFPNRLY
jgi:polar amino acid transport system substrate-binding protein